MNFLGEATVRVSAVLALAFLVMWVGPRVLRPPRESAFNSARPTVAGVPAPAPGFTWNDSAQLTPLLYDAVVGMLFDIGVLVCAWRMIRGAARARSLRKTAAPLDAAAVAAAAGLPPALFQGAGLAQSDIAAVAMTVGVKAPLILLPAHYSLWDRAR